MKAREFKKVANYREQAPRCYLCHCYADREGKKFCTANPDEMFRVKPNAICDEYKPGEQAKNKE